MIRSLRWATRRTDSRSESSVLRPYATSTLADATVWRSERAMGRMSPSATAYSNGVWVGRGAQPNRLASRTSADHAVSGWVGPARAPLIGDEGEQPDGEEEHQRDDDEAAVR